MQSLLETDNRTASRFVGQPGDNALGEMEEEIMKLILAPVILLVAVLLFALFRLWDLIMGNDDE